MKKCLIIITFLIMAIGAAGQEFGTREPEQKPPVRQRLFFGGSFGLQFGTVTNIEVSPLVGIWLLPRLAVGAGPSFQFYDDPYGSTMIYGGRAMLQFNIIQDLNNLIPLGLNTGIFAHGEYEALSLEKAFFTTNTESSGRIYYGSFLIGGGISQPTGKRSSMNITFLWNLSDNVYGLYDNPEIRIEFYF
jgi:hypothetical protein